MHVSFFLFYCLHTHQTTLALPRGGSWRGQTHQTPTNHNSSPPAEGVGGGKPTKHRLIIIALPPRRELEGGKPTKPD